MRPTGQPRRSPDDQHVTETSDIQAKTESVLLKHLPANPDSPPHLQKNAHLQYLVRNLVQGFPYSYISQDASQPWLMYWTLQSFSLMGVALDPDNKQKVINTILAWQHPEGGFGGGPGQAPHLLPTYASVCALAIVGRPGPGGGWDQIDKENLYRFFMSLKQPDGSFLVSHDAEVDVRGTYCLLVVAYLLDLITPELLRGTPAFVASCQTYEGGFSSASQPYFIASSSHGTTKLLDTIRPPLGEAHGGYTFCALASWIMLQPYFHSDHHSSANSKPSVDYKRLMRWLVQMQGSESELGGFRGRTNKLVDGCYSWWVGGCFALLASQGIGGYRGPSQEDHERTNPAHDEASWHDVDESVWNQQALQRYILCAAQHPSAGLRDKPPKSSDAYHTLYCLAGLSAAQHNVFPSPARRAELSTAWQASVHPNGDELRKAAFVEALSWTEEDGTSHVLGGQVNRVNATHPVFNLTMTHTEGVMSHFYKQTLPHKSAKH
ncbi:terpenoid cyclases/protein prenyltransferase alpha-alpha toroid [Phlebopus sp. FC_14]|nr:terpenoid cyclases/protein prenyltransferase alpha-alpha toroid [Phlebopus sp. FC_14]